MSRVERFKAFFNKENVDYSQGPVDPYEFHKTFYHMCKAFRVLDNERIPKWTILTPIMVVFAGALAAFICFISMVKYITIFDVPLITESGTYLLVMVYKLLIISAFITDKAQFSSFLQAMREDFKYICTKGSKYRVRYFENHLWTWKASILSTIFIFIIGSGMSGCSVIALIFFIIFPTEGESRPLPFPFWIFDIDLGKTPIYEVTYIFSHFCVFTHVITYIFMMNSQIVWIRQITSKADIIIWSIEDLLVDVHPTKNAHQKEYYDNIIKARMREIIAMHHSMYRLLDDYAGVYRKLLMYEQKLCGPIVCLTAYGSAEKMDAGEIPGIMGLLCTAVIILVFIPSYMCTILGEKVRSIGDACWNAPFWNAPGAAICPYFILIMQRSSRPLPIQAPGFDEVSLQTFSDIMKFAYTGFNMLRQVDN